MDQPIETRPDLILALKDAAELEQQFMCMYLYAAFSLKRAPDDTCGAAQFEQVRRWASTIYMVARQEMEHLSLVNSMLAAIGAPPHFSRHNMPVQHPRLRAQVLAARDKAHLNNDQAATRATPCDLPFLLGPFELRSARRYACMESPEIVHLSGKQKAQVSEWCYQDQDHNCNCVLPGTIRPLELHRLHYRPAELSGKPGAANDMRVGTIEEMYDRIKQGFTNVAKNDPSLFVPPYAQRQVEILSEYNIYIFPVTDLASACNAIDLITRQGEGLGGPPGFDSHFLNFYEIALEYQQILGVTGCGESQSGLLPAFTPALPVPRDPSPDHIRNQFTKDVFELFNYSYVTLLYMLTGLYGWYVPEAQDSYPYLSSALRETTFAPAMTMLIRSLGEVLVQLPLDKDPHQCAGPSFHITKADDRQLQINPRILQWREAPHARFYTDIDSYLARFQHIVDTLNKLKVNAGAPDRVKRSLAYISENALRILLNLQQIYQSGVYITFRTVS